jgi:predicted kinase
MTTGNKLIVLSGLPGSGKSTLSNLLSQKTGSPVLSVDPIESSIIKSGIEKSFETGYAAYLVAETLAKEQLNNGLSVIIDAVNAEDEAKQVWIRLAKELDISIVVLECTLDEEIHKARLAARVRGLHGIEEISWDRIEERRSVSTIWPTESKSVDTIEITPELIDSLIEYIDRFK